MIAQCFMFSFTGKMPTPITIQKKVSGPADDQKSMARGLSLQRSVSPSPQGSVSDSVGNRADLSSSRVSGQPKKVPTKGSAMATTSKGPFTGEYCMLLSLNQPPKGVDPRDLWAHCRSLREIFFFYKMVMEGNPDLCMHLLNMIIPP